MRPFYRFVLKWFTVAIVLAIVFHYICDTVVGRILSLDKWSTFETKTREMIWNYEQSLIAWAHSGQRVERKTSFDQQKTKHRDDLELIGVHVFFRHGARTPLHLLPSLDEVVYTKEHIEHYAPAQWQIKLIAKIGNETVEKEKIASEGDLNSHGRKILKSVEGVTAVTGQLTAVGEKQLFELGQSLRDELIGDEKAKLIPSIYDPSFVYCRSTYMNRTLASARSFLAGLFTSDKSKSQIDAKGPFEIEVHHFPHEYLFPNPQISPSLRNCISAIELYTSLHDEHVVKRARHVFLVRIGALNYSDGIIELYDEIVSRQAHRFSLPDDILELSRDFEILSAREFIFRATSIGFETFVRSTIGPVLYLIRENFQSVLDNFLAKKSIYQKLFIYSGHDTTILPLAMALEIFDMRWPKYAASIVIKLYVSKKDSTQTFVTVDAAGERQILPNCSDYYCSYATFLDNLRHRFDQPKVPNHH